MMAGILMLTLAASSPLFAQTNADEVTQLKQRVAQLEKQVQEMSQLLEPLKAQQAIDNRRKLLREKFENKAALDQKKHTPEQLREAEQLYQVANQKWGSPEATESLRKMTEMYPDINRTGCAILYLAQNSQGEERARYLQDCIEKHNDCFYGDGVQVGVYARCLLAQDCRSQGDDKKADALCAEIKSQYSDAVDHGGKLLVDQLDAPAELTSVVGVGLVLFRPNQRELLMARDIVPNSPAAKAGIKPGSLIVSIAGADPGKMSLAECVRLIRGAPDTQVTLGIVDPANQLTNVVTLKRETIWLNHSSRKP
jgi:hypothetical protein